MKKILIPIYIVAVCVAIGGWAYATYEPPITEGVIYYENGRNKSERYIRANGDWKHVDYFFNEDGTLRNVKTAYSTGSDGVYEYYGDGTGRLVGLSGKGLARLNTPADSNEFAGTILGYEVQVFDAGGVRVAYSPEFRAYLQIGNEKAVRIVEMPITDALFGERPRDAKIDYNSARNDLKRFEDQGLTDANNEGVKKLRSLIPAEEFDKPLVPNACDTKKK